VVQNVESRGDIALVEVVAGQEPVRLVRFYRQTGLGWKHTAPRAEFWRDTVERASGAVTVRYRERDLHHVELLIEHILRVFGNACTLLGCPSDYALEVDLAPVDTLPDVSGDKLILPSPWLSGIPVEGVWSETYLDELAYWVTYQVAFQLIHSDAERGLGQVQEALPDRHVAVQEREDTSRASGWEYIAGHDGVDPLPQVLRTLQSVYATSLLLAESPSAPSVLDMDRFRVLMAVEREASRVGLEVTSLLLDEHDYW
jgi:hypothetical protein